MGALKALLPLVVKQSSVWLGLQGGGPRTWSWSVADHHFYKAGERNYRNLRTDSDTYFTVTSKDGIWIPHNSKSKQSYVMCYDGKEPAARVTTKLTNLDEDHTHSKPT